MFLLRKCTHLDGNAMKKWVTVVVGEVTGLAPARGILIFLILFFS